MSDFSNILDVGVPFSRFELDEGVDFYNIGDGGVIIVEGSGYGDDGYGDGPYGGSETTIIIDNPTTEWTNIFQP